ncbi:MAG: tetratricopeptide repeat protein, partial [Alphaproteobacteria bacterium]|nr:tetratricopeptide repeat protein [Alphaproteobacteria bacterium]
LKLDFDRGGVVGPQLAQTAPVGATSPQDQAKAKAKKKPAKAKPAAKPTAKPTAKPAAATPAAVAAPAAAAPTPAAPAATSRSAQAAPGRVAAGAVDREMQALFQQVLANPGSVELNLRYAKLAEQKGQARKAVAAYDRVLQSEPGNAEAKAALARLSGAVADPDRTEVIALAGITYETNPLQRNLDLSTSNEFSLAMGAQVRDDRRIGGIRLVSQATGIVNKHINTDEVDVGYVGLAAGPVFEMSSGMKVHTQATFDRFAFEGKTAATSYGARADLGLPDAGPLQGVRVAYAFDQFSKVHRGRDAHVLAVKGGLGWTSLFQAGDRLEVAPNLIRNQAGARRYRYTEASAETTYYMPLAQDVAGFSRLVLGPALEVGLRSYSGREATDPDKRKDLFFAPGLKLIGDQFMGLPLGATFRVGYDRNFSNVKDHNRDNFAVGLSLSYKLSF